MADNPIKYSDLLSPDNSIKQAIEQLKELNNTYAETLAKVRDEAGKTSKSLSSISGATEQGRKAISNSATEADRIARLEERLAQAYSDNAKKIAELQAKLREKNAMTKAEIQLNSSAEGSYNQLSAKYSIMKQQLNAMSKAQREGTAEGRKLEQEAKRIYEEMDRLQRATGKYALNVGNYAKSFRQAFAELAKGKNVAKNIGNMFSSGFNAGAQGLQGGLMTIGTSISSSMFGAMAVFNKFSDAVQNGMDTIISFEKENSRLKAILGESSEGMQELSNDAKRLGAETRYTASEVTQLQIELAKLGFAKYQILDMTEGILKFALATGSELSEASALAGAALRMFGAEAKETDRYVSAMAVSTTKSALSFSYLQTALPIVGGAAKAMNFSIEDTLAILGQLANAGLDASSAATATRNIILNLADANSKLSRTLGHPVKNAEELAAALKELDERGIDLATSLKITDKRSVVAFNNLIRNAESIKTLREQVTGVKGELDKMADTMGDNVAGSLARLSSAWEALVLRFEGSKGFMRNAIDELTSFVNWVSKLIGEVEDAEALAKRLNGESRKGGKTNIDKQMDRLGGSKHRDVLNSAYESAYEKEIEKAKQNIKTWNEKKVNARIDNDADEFEIASQNAQKAITKLKALEINYAEYKKRASKIMSPTTTTDDSPKGDGVVVPLTDKELKAQEAERQRQLREKEKAYQENLKAQRAYEDAQLSIQEEGYAKERQKILYQYDRKIEDLKHQLQTEEKLTAQGTSAITNEVVALQAKRTQELEKLQDKYALKELQFQRDELKAELDIVESTDIQLKKKMQLLEVERQIALAQNRQKPVGERRSEASINAGFSAKKNSLLSTNELSQFDLVQKLAQSEFDLLKTTEDEKTRFKLNAEKERWKKVLELNAKYGKSMSDVEIKTINNTIAKIDSELSKPKKFHDIYEIIGLKLDNDQRQAVQESVSYITGQLSEILDSYVQIAEQEYQNAQNKTNEARNLLQSQLEARANGYASDVKTAQKEVALAEKEEAEKLKIKEKYDKAQQALEATQQAVSLITASANIWQSMSVIPVVGPALAIASIAAMWTSFAISRAKAHQAASQKYREGGYEFLDGGSHQSGNDVSLGRTSDGRDRKAEGGETLAIFNKNATRKYRNTIPSIVDAINHGMFEEKFGHAFSANGVVLSPSLSFNTRNLERDVAEIRKQGERSVTYSGNTKIIQYHNLTRIIHV